MKRLSLMTIMLWCCFGSLHHAFAQEFLPFAVSNYAGVSGVMLQPASIADSRYKFDMVLSGFTFQASNNYLAIDREAIFRPSLWDEPSFGNDHIYRNLNGKDKKGLIAAGLVLPSFMINLDARHSIAFSSRIRGQVNIDRLTEDLAEVMAENFDNPEFYNIILNNANLSSQTNWWAEFNLTYAEVVPLHTDRHLLKGGLTVKYLQGIASGYAYVEDLSFRLEEPDVISVFKSHINYGISDNLDTENIKPFDFVSDPGFGMDLGLVYEFRPNIDRYRYNMDGKEGMLRPDKDKYLLRVGVSLLDLGGLKFQKGYNSQDFTADVENWDISQVEISSIQDLNDTLANRFNFGEIVTESYRMKLPTALSLQVDYNIGKGFYLNLSPYFALRKGTNIISKTHYFTTLSLVPRYDIKWWGAALPLQVDENGKARAGIALRLGPVWIGSNSIVSNVISSKIYNADAYVMLKIPVFRGIPRDKDLDAVSNKFDECPETPGIWAQKGCPDRDGDGITDDKDDCPSEAGLVELNGCPDRDGDGITDRDDHCPDVKGLPLLNGCPDSDGDGVTDAEDRCPNQAGLAELKGCPDRDNDGIADMDDNCPDEPGKAEFNGCPFADYDKDGVPDEVDDCPSLPGPAASNGCPDSDGDGVADNKDLCPKTPGTIANNGCPEILKEEKAILVRAFSNLEFETGRSVIKSSSYSSLDELASLLLSHPDWKVKLSGHTDNTGSAEKNMELSKNRAQAVKDYLISKEVKEYHIIAEWFGQEQPIADNKTAAGRQKNRRVEMKIEFD